MKMKKIFVILFMFITTSFLISCDFDSLFNQTTTSVIELSTLPEPVGGTITFLDSDYATFPSYVSETYSIKNIDDYNNVLLDTKEYVRHANIQIQTTLIEERYPYPWSDTLKEYVVGSSSGSGFVFMEKDGYYYAITNYHVVNPDDYQATYMIQTYNEEEPEEATLVAGNEEFDLAVVRFPVGDKTNVTIIDIYERLYYKFNVGELVLAVGNPLGVANNVTFGEFNGMRTIENAFYDVMYHDASIKEGSSGGALVDVDGNLLGVNTWGVDSEDDYSFAIPNYIVYTFLVNYGVLDE